MKIIIMYLLSGYKPLQYNETYLTCTGYFLFKSDRNYSHLRRGNLNCGLVSIRMDCRHVHQGSFSGLMIDDSLMVFITTKKSPLYHFPTLVSFAQLLSSLCVFEFLFLWFSSMVATPPDSSSCRMNCVICPEDYLGNDSSVTCVSSTPPSPLIFQHKTGSWASMVCKTCGLGASSVRNRS